MGHNNTGGGGVATYIIELAVASVLLALGVTVMISSWKLGAGWTTDGPGSGYFPFYMGVLLSISAVGVMYDSLFKEKNEETFVDRTQFKRVLSVLIPAGLYIVGIQILGIYLASTIYIGLFMIILGKYSWIKGFVVGLAVNIFFFFMFEVWFRIPLFKGALNPTSIFGY